MPYLLFSALALSALCLAFGCSAPGDEVFSETDFERRAVQVVPRDSFPVLDEPVLVRPDELKLELRDEEPVIGLALGGEARAHPLTVLGNFAVDSRRCGTHSGLSLPAESTIPSVEARHAPHLPNREGRTLRLMNRPG